MLLTIDSQLAAELGYPDSVIIANETDELKSLIKVNHIRKSELILSAAKKLEESNYPNNTHVIAAKITKVWAKMDIHPDTIQKALPDKYKRAYKKPQPIKPTELQSIFLELKSVFLQAGKLYGSYASKIENDPKIKEIVLQELNNVHNHEKYAKLAIKELMDRIKKIIDFKSLYYFIQKLGIECEAIERLMDERQKFPLAWKFNLKILMIIVSYNHLATLLVDHKKNGAKWLSKIDSNPNIEKLFQSCYSCPACNWDGRLYYEQLKIAMDKDMAIPEITTGPQPNETGLDDIVQRQQLPPLKRW